MIPEDGEDKLNSMDMLGSFPENRIKPSESNDNSVSSKEIENDVNQNYWELLDKAAKNTEINNMSALERLGYVTGTVSKTLSDTKDELIDEPVKGFWDGFKKAQDKN